jgi:hypothetical protein
MRLRDDYDEIWTIAVPISSTQLARTVTQWPIISRKDPSCVQADVQVHERSGGAAFNSIFHDSTIFGWRGSLQDNDTGPSRYDSNGMIWTAMDSQCQRALWRAIPQ